MTMTSEERHALHHEHLAATQERIDCIWAAQYARAKQHKVHAPRKFATRATHSQRVSQVAAWRSHLQGLHGVKNIGPFVGLAELQAMHAELHEKESR